MTLPAGTAGNAGQARGARASAGQAVAGFEAVAGLARAEAFPEDALPPGTRRGPGEDHTRLARTVCALRHLVDQYSGLSFARLLYAADEQYRQLGTGYARPVAAGRARRAGEAVSACDRSLTTPTQYRGSFWPPDTRDYLNSYASQHGQRLEEAVAALTTRLLAGLRHYADHQGTDFQQALAAGLTAHAWQRLSDEGPFQTGQSPAPGHAPQATAPFPPCATNQGVVISAADAEWLLVRTAARNLASEQAGLPPDRRDADDECVLTQALAGARGQRTREVFARLAPGIAARIMQLEDGPAAAAALGREHGHARTVPYCDLSTEGDAAALMRALGETEPMTDANHQYRVLLVTAYAEAYRQAAGPRLPPADYPARIAARDFPRTTPPAAQPGTPAALDPGTRSRAAPQAPPRHGPRPGA
jgi:hypothetical protein